jgi:serine/threonine-protein kinase HipA
MSTNSCSICLQPLKNNETRYHPACCKKLFGSAQPPTLPYTWDQLNGMAEQVVRRHVAVPGVQPKLSMHLERSGRSRDSRLTLVGLGGDFILKPAVERYPEMPELEHLTMRMARSFGIDSAECGLIPLEDGQLAFITKRMDREGGEKLHMEDMCQLSDRLTEQKYRGSMEQVGRAVLRHCSNPLFDALRLFELTLFCFLTGNADMHLKNFSLLYRLGGEVHLSPAYDLLPTKLLLPEDMEETALTLNGKKRRIDRNDFMRFGTSLQLTEKQVENAFARFSNQLADTLDLLEQGLCRQDMKKRYRAVMEERTARLDLTPKT